MAASVTFYNSFKEYMADGTIDLDNATFKVMLTTSAYTPSATHTVKADVTNEISATNGYTAGGVTVAATWVRTSGTVAFDLADAVWTAAGGSLSARYAVVYASGSMGSPSVTDPLVCYILLDTTPQDVTATDTNQLKVVFNASGLFTLS